MNFPITPMVFVGLCVLGLSAISVRETGNSSFQIEEVAFATDYYTCQRVYWDAYEQCRRQGNTIEDCFDVAGEASDQCKSGESSSQSDE